MSYRVEIKRSARRRNAAAGEAIVTEGPFRTFEDRSEADEWASRLAERGDRPVWIQDAPPHDRSRFDGYLVSRRPRRQAEAPFESEQTRLEHPPGEP